MWRVIIARRWLTSETRMPHPHISPLRPLAPLQTTTHLHKSTQCTHTCTLQYTCTLPHTCTLHLNVRGLPETSVPAADVGHHSSNAAIQQHHRPTWRQHLLVAWVVVCGPCFNYHLVLTSYSSYQKSWVPSSMPAADTVNSNTLRYSSISLLAAGVTCGNFARPFHTHTNYFCPALLTNCTTSYRSNSNSCIVSHYSCPTMLIHCSIILIPMHRFTLLLPYIANQLYYGV